MSKKKKYRNVLDHGYEIWLDFVLNDQQKEVIKQIDDFINDPKEFAMTISGWAGTGKTTLMEIVNRRYWMGHTVHFAATTHKAAGVLKEKVGKKVFTVNSLFGIMIETDMEGETYDVSKKARKMADDKVKPNSIIIIDEASMLSIQNYKDVVLKAMERKCKIIFIGDSAQLSPVNEDDISVVFRNTDHRIVELTKVMRTDDNSILDESSSVRLNGGYTYVTHINEEGNGVKYINNTDVKEILNVIDSHIDGLKDDPNFFRVLTYTNANVEKLNMMIRKKLGYDGLDPQPGEPLMAYGNWGYMGMGVSGAIYQIVNSEAYNCKSIINEYDEDISDMITYTNEGRLDDYNIHIIDIDVEDSLGNIINVPLIDVKNNEHNREIVVALAYEKVHQWGKYRESEDKMERVKCLEKINAIDEFLFVNDNVYDKYGTLIQAKMIDYGYAHTIHKSQGSTFTHVLINDDDISRCMDKNVRRQLRYVAVTRAQKSANIITSHTVS
jgi:exodeoxyribonuclease-5